MSRPAVYHESCAYVVGRELVQVDYDYPGAATRCGWSILRVQQRDGRAVAMARVNRERLAAGHDCHHSGTDGTVDCRECGCTASDFIRAAGEHLDRLAQ